MQNCGEGLGPAQKMKKNNDPVRIIIAITDRSPLPQLWRAALECMSGSQIELRAIFFADDRWQKAASLPITCEVSRIGGGVADFTVERAEQICEEAIASARSHLQRLASEADLGLTFDVLSESEKDRISELIVTGSILVAPSFITRRPIYTHLQKSGCRMLIIEETNEYWSDWHTFQRTLPTLPE